MKYIHIFFKHFILILIFLNSCEKTGTDPDSNKNPETTILSYVISPNAEIDSSSNPTSIHKTTVYWNGTDVDGEIKTFLFSTDRLNYDTTSLTQHDFNFDFSSLSSTYKVWVKSVDELGAEDPTPAATTIKLNFNIEIETSIIDGPPNGAEVSPGVRFIVNTTTNFGYVRYISYKVDNGNWTDIAVDTLGTATVDVIGLDIGVRTLYFAGKQFDEQKDETPVTTSLIVKDGFKPIIVNESPVAHGGGWFSIFELPFSWKVIVDHYYGVLPPQPYSYAIDDSIYFNYNPDFPLSSGWIDDTIFTIILPEGMHTFYLKVKDIAGNVEKMKIDFLIVPSPFEQGILVVNGVDPQIYGSIYQNKIDSSAYWGSFSVHFWDIFGTMDTPSLNLPANVTYEGGGASLSPGIMAYFSTIVWLGNNYNGDLEAWFQSPVLSYLTAGGNIIFASRHAADFLPQELTDYLNIGWREGNAPGSSAGSTIEEYIPLFPVLISMEPFLRTMTATSVFSSYPFNAGGSVFDEDVTNWNGSRSFSQNEFSTLLFAHRSSVYDTSYTFDFVRGLGVWTHPNFAFSSLIAGNEFPTPGTIEANGNFILINGRHYGFNTQACRQNFEFILRNMCGEDESF